MSALKFSIITVSVIVGAYCMVRPPSSNSIGHSRSEQTLIALQKFGGLIANNPWFVANINRVVPRDASVQVLDSKKFYFYATSLDQFEGVNIVFDDESEKRQEFTDSWSKPYRIKFVKSGQFYDLYIWSVGRDGIDQMGDKDDILVKIPLRNSNNP